MQTEKQKLWRQNNPDKIKAQRKRWRQKNIEHIAEYHKKYYQEHSNLEERIIKKVKRKERSRLWAAGKNKRVLKHQEKIAGRERPEQCEICGEIGIICFDHDHSNGKFRGWICARCNFVLGLVKDNSKLLIELIKYLENYENIQKRQ